MADDVAHDTKKGSIAGSKKGLIARAIFKICNVLCNTGMHIVAKYSLHMFVGEYKKRNMAKSQKNVLNRIAAPNPTRI